MKHWEKDATPSKEILAKMPDCIESMYIDEKAKALIVMTEVEVRDDKFVFSFEIDLPQEEGFLLSRELIVMNSQKMEGLGKFHAFSSWMNCKSLQCQGSLTLYDQ